MAATLRTHVTQEQAGGVRDLRRLRRVLTPPNAKDKERHATSLRHRLSPSCLHGTIVETG